MHARTQFNRILLVWLLMLSGLGLAQARSHAACDMPGVAQMAPDHSCCVKKSVCACDAGRPAALHNAARPGAKQIVCGCVVHSQPVRSAPPLETLRAYHVAALPTRAGPFVISFIAPAALAAVSSQPATCSFRFVSPSSPRAPPFQA